jgi:competence protein ComEC
LNYKYPLIKAILIIPFGYLFNYIFDINSLQLGIAFLIVLTLSILRINNIIKYISIFLLAGIYISFQHNLYNIDKFKDKVSISFDGVVKGNIIEIISDNDSFTKVLAKVNINSFALENTYETNIILSIFKSDKNKAIILKPGYDIKANVSLRTPNIKTLPNDFNEISYLKSNKAHFFAFSNWLNFSFVKRNKISTYLYDIKEYMKYSIKFYLKDFTYKSILIALATGDKSDIDYETRHVFSKTGTAHVLAISGLHVGLIAGFIYIITGFIQNRTFKLTLFLILVWIFIILTGASASGIRAGFMISMFFILKYFNRVPNIINIALATFIISILINPMVLYSISFQLSYSAIFGIIFLYKSINNNIKSFFGIRNSKTLRFIISSISISFAATITTSLFTAYYFNVFSVIYPIANIFIIPLVSLATAFNFIFIFLELLFVPFSKVYLEAAYYLIELSVNINSFLLNYDIELFDRGVNIELLSVLSSLILIIIFISKKRKDFIHRFVIGGSLIIVLLFSDILIYKPKKIEIIPREQFVAVIFNKSSNKTVLIVDRKDYDYIKNDYVLEDYILKDSINVNLLKTSDASININDRIKKYEFVSSKFVSREFVDSLSNSLEIRSLYNVVNNEYGHN